MAKGIYRDNIFFSFPCIFNNLGLLVSDKDRAFGRAYGLVMIQFLTTISFPPDANVEESEMIIYSAKKYLSCFIKMPYL